MKPRHAAALALVGWYLMSPPIVIQGGKAKIDSDAPLSKWRTMDYDDWAYDKKSECEQANANLHVLAEREKEHPVPGVSAELNDRSYVYRTNQHCISTKDPRLDPRLKSK
jgi:hypothetical protein